MLTIPVKGQLMATIEIRPTKAGKPRYRVLIRVKGQKPVSRTFARKTDAKRWADRTQEALRDGSLRLTPGRGKTLSDLTERYLADQAALGQNVGPKRRHLSVWHRELGNLYLLDLTPDRICQVRDRLLTEPGPKGRPLAASTVVRHLATLSHAFGVAVREWGWLPSNPVQAVRRPREPRGRNRCLSDDERGRLLDACAHSTNSMLLPIVLLALGTGMRRGEILGLTWRDVDLKTGQIIIQESKNGDRRSVVADGLPAKELRRHAKVRRLGSELVFPGRSLTRPIDFTTAWARAIEAAEISGFRFHDLRHSFASYLAMQGATQAELMAALGHRTVQMTARYTHLSAPHVASVVRRMTAEYLDG